MDDKEISIVFDSKFPFDDLTNSSNHLKKDEKASQKNYFYVEDPKPSSKFSNGHLDLNLVDPSLEVIDPNPDVFSLFVSYNHQFFWGALDSCTVEWSKRMTLCAGICCFQPRSGFCSIKLSEPLLKLRPRSDLIETLLHEMIHAYLFVTTGHQDRDGHGSEFQSHMNRINVLTGTNITIYHSFHDEVASYKQHWWRCTGICRERPPYYGWVKRSINRAPGPYDFWWKVHKATCDGTFEKVKEPEKKVKKGSLKNGKNRKKKEN